MASEGTCKFIGASGTNYTYHIYPIGTTFKEADGNYIYAKKNTEGEWVLIYIGEGDLADRSKLEQDRRGECISAKGATHFLCHLNASHDERRDEETDLLANYPDAYEPTGCNVKRGG